MARFHIIKRGECLSSLTKRYGFRRYHTLYDDAANASFKQRRPDPNELVPDEQIVIVDKEAKREEAETGRRHTFFVASEPTFLRLRIRYAVPVDYELTVGDSTASGTTDGSALVSMKIEADARSGRLRLWRKGAPRVPEKAFEYTLELGCLQPLDTAAGVQGRLLNLGFYRGPLDGSLTAATKQAIRAFEESQGREPHGENTEELRALLKGAHDD